MIYKRIVEEKITMKDMFDKLGVSDDDNSVYDVKFPLKVKTPYGYKNIKTAFRTEKQQSITTYFKNNKTLKTSGKHLLRVNGEWKSVNDIVEDDIVETETGTTSIKNKHYGKEESLYDISVEDVHCYYSNGIVSHNSWILARLGAEAMRQGKNVVHFTLELNENYVGLRYDCCFTSIDFQNIKNNIDRVKSAIEKVPGKLFIKYYPVKTASSNTIKCHIDRIQMLGTKIDMIIVDYADILRPNVRERNSNSYQDAGGIYEELRGIAGELQIPCWTASQCNRASLEDDIIQAESIADSYRKIMTADFVMSVSRKVNDKRANTARFHVIKNRFGPDGITFPSRFNAGNGDIQLYNEKSREGMGVITEMNERENLFKKMLSDKWNNHLREDDDE